MKNKLRKIHIDNVDFLWSVGYDKGNEDFILLRIWIDGQKSRPWIAVHYQYHNPWIYFGELVGYKNTRTTRKSRLSISV